MGTAAQLVEEHQSGLFLDRQGLPRLNGRLVLLETAWEPQWKCRRAAYWVTSTPSQVAFILIVPDQRFAVRRKLHT